MEATNERENAVAKIRKLLNLARDGAATEQEAATAARQAEAMMRKWQVDAGDVVLDEIQRDDAFDQDMADVSFEGRENYVSKAVPSWVGYIAVGIGQLYSVKVDVVAHRELGVKVRFSGYAPDVVVAKWTYETLCQTIYRLSKQHGKGRGMAFAKSFRLGAAAKLQQMLYDMSHENKAEAQATGYGLVLYQNKMARVEEMYGATNTKQHRHSATDRDGYNAGKEAAGKIHINKNAPIKGQASCGQLSHF